MGTEVPLQPPAVLNDGEVECEIDKILAHQDWPQVMLCIMERPASRGK